MNESKKNCRFKRYQSEDLLEGIKGVHAEMQAKGLITEETTFEEMADYAGRHILITENKDDLEYALNEGDKELFEEYAKQRKEEFEDDLVSLMHYCSSPRSFVPGWNDVKKNFAEKWGPK